MVENPFLDMGGFSVETCLRFIALRRRLPAAFPPDVQVYQGIMAYRFMLEVACGLHSKIQGESEIFGQIKQAWKQYHEADPVASKPLHTLMQHLFADTKRIRTHYLHGIGGQSYAGATQKLLGLKKNQSVLIIGAGQFGAMLAAKLPNVTLMNRSPKENLNVVVGWDTLEHAIAEAHHVLVCIPHGQDAALDTRIQTAWQQKRHGKLIHYGQMELAGTGWEAMPHVLSLADVMALQNTQGEAKPQRIAQAFEAIRTAAAERANGVSFKSRVLEVA